MKFNKVIRDYMSETLRNRMNEIEKSDPLKISYLANKASAKAEIEEILEPVYRQVAEVLERYGMDLTYKDYNGNTYSKAKAAVKFYDTAIENKDIQTELSNRTRSRMLTVEKKMKEIELECALGADREAFMKMLDEVVIE